MKNMKYLVALILIFGAYINLLASDYPIIAIHGIYSMEVTG